MCMIGTIHTDQKCSLCNSKFRDNKKNALVCSKHPEQTANKFRVYFRGVSKRFKSYNEASRFLTGIRFKTDENTFDARDYRENNPLGFKNLALQWLRLKEKTVKHTSFQSIENHISKAIAFLENTNVKDIKPKDFQLFLKSLNLTDKTKHNYLSTITQFFKWLYDNEEIDRLPKFPKQSFELAWRKTIDKDTQQEIISEVYRISNHINPKIWIGIRWLSIYVNLRPAELTNIKEGNIDLKQGEIVIPNPKERKPKIVFLLKEDIELIRSFPIAMPHLYLFRHTPGLSGVRAGSRFGPRYLYKWWKKACSNLGIYDVDLYGGTRHSSVRALRKYRTPEEIKMASMHSTNKAFERYFQIESDHIRDIYKDAQRGTKGGKEVAKDFKRL